MRVRLNEFAKIDVNEWQPVDWPTIIQRRGLTTLLTYEGEYLTYHVREIYTNMENWLNVLGEEFITTWGRLIHFNMVSLAQMLNLLIRREKVEIPLPVEVWNEVL